MVAYIESWMEEYMIRIKEMCVKCDICNEPYDIKCEPNE